MDKAGKRGRAGQGEAGRGKAGTAAPGGAEDLDRLAEDWITLWQTELAGLAADPDWVALTQHGLAIGAGWMRLMTAFAVPPGAGQAPGAAAQREAAPHDRRDAPPRPAPAAAAPGDGGAPGLDGAGHGAARGADPGAGEEAEALRRRIADLEQRLAALERRPRGSGADRPGARRRRPSA